MFLPSIAIALPQQAQESAIAPPQQHPFDSNLLEPTLQKSLPEHTKKLEISMRHPTSLNK
jgi:hypothetical protein